MNLSITGYGACMIAGFPLPGEAGFLHEAVRRMQPDGRLKIALEVISMGGFPATRASKHFAKKALGPRPDIVVLQFGSTDASAPLRRGFGVRHFSKNNPHGRIPPSIAPPKPGDLAKWQIRNLASELILVPPTVPLDEYLEAVLSMTNEARAVGSSVVVLSPFIMGGGRSNRFARRYADGLAHQLHRLPDAHYLDAHALLSGSAPREMLLSDGFHLSARAHEKLGVALAELLVRVAFERCGRLRENPATKPAPKA